MYSAFKTFSSFWLAFERCLPIVDRKMNRWWRGSLAILAEHSWRKWRKISHAMQRRNNWTTASKIHIHKNTFRRIQLLLNNISARMKNPKNREMFWRRELYIGGRLSQWINFEILEFVLGFESWGDKTTKKQLCYSLLSLKRSSSGFFFPVGRDANLAYDL